MSETITWASEADFRLVQQKCEDILDKITWRCTDQFNENTTLAEAVQLAKMDRDGGREGLRFIIPKTSEFADWMDYAFILTMYYNRTHNPRYYTIIRNMVYAVNLSV